MGQPAEQVNPEAGAAADREHGAGWKERRATRRRLLLWTLGFASLTYGAMVLYFMNILPLWGLIAANVLFYIRSYLRMHDLCHGFSTKGWVVRFVPTALFSNPVWGGTTAFITTHVQHHHYLGSDQDPWLPYYAGHPLRALFFNMIEPEHNLYNYLRQKRGDRKLLENLAFDVAKQVVHLLVFQWAWLTHVIIQRICHGLGVFLFNFWPHREHWTAKATMGAFNREREIRPWATLLGLFWGKVLVEAAMYHNRHHVLGQMPEPSHRYVVLTDQGTYTRHNDQWPLAEVQHLARGPRIGRASAPAGT